MVLRKISNTTEFKEAIMLEDAVIMIHKTNCPYCVNAFPWMDELSEKYPEKFMGEVNKDDISKVLEVFQIKMCPTFIYAKKGKIEDVFYGNTQYELVVDFVERNLTRKN